MSTPPKICLVGTGYNAATSLDGGSTWTYSVLPSVFGAPANGPLWHVVAAPFGFLATPWTVKDDSGLYYGNYSGVAVSTDGVTWSLKVGVDGVGDGAPYSNPIWLADAGKIAFTGNENFYTYDGAVFTSTYMGAMARLFLQQAGNKIISMGSYEGVTTTRVSSNGGATWGAGPSWARTISGACSDGTYVWACSSEGALARTDGVSWTEVATGGSFDMAAVAGASVLSFGRDAVATSAGKGATATLSTAAMPITPDRSWTLVLPYPPPTAYPGMVMQDAWKLGSWMAGTIVGEEIWLAGSAQASDTGVPSVVKSSNGLAYTQVTGITPTNGAGRRDWTGIAAYEPAQILGSLTETVEFSGTVDSSPSQVLASTSDTLSVAFSFGVNQQLQAAITDMLVMFSDGSAAWPVDAIIADGVILADGGTQGSFDPYDAINNPTQFAVDPVTGAVSIYTGYDFDQYASVGQDLYAVRADGVYLLRGADDAGQLINAGVDLGASSFGTTRAKNIEAVYLGLETDGEVYVRVAAAGGERIYRVVKRGPLLRALCAKGVTDRTWGVKIDIEQATAADMDVVEIFTGINTRRWTR